MPTSMNGVIAIAAMAGLVLGISFVLFTLCLQPRSVEALIIGGFMLIVASLGMLAFLPSSQADKEPPPPQVLAHDVLLLHTDAETEI
jgi:multisubunit Na+/H+ antiporter MnhB subunit